MFDHHHYPMLYSWCHVDGTIGLNSITYKYPDALELIESWTNKIKAFPYLDLVVAITNWDAMPPEAWEAFFKGDENFPFEQKEWDEQFYAAVEIGIHVHDGIIELLDRETAIYRYKKYDEAYLLQCVRLYGLDPEKVTTFRGDPVDFNQWEKDMEVHIEHLE